MSEIRQCIPYSDIVVGDDFNSRKSFRALVNKAFVGDNNPAALKSESDLKKVLDETEWKTLSKLKELASSIEEHGLLNPLLVREGGPARTDGKRKYFLIAGERRFRAIGLIREKNPQKFKLVDIKLKKCNATDSVILNIIENLQRENLEPMEAARSMRQVLDTTGLTQAQLAQKLGKSEPYVSQHLGLLKAAPEVQAAVEDGNLTATHVREMSTLPPEKQKEVLRVVEGKKAKGQKVSVSDVKIESDKVKKALGIKKERERKPKDGEPIHDAEKIKVAKDAIGDRDVVIRSKKALLEQYGALYQRLNHPNVSEATVITTKAKISTIEYCLGVRDSL